jgi:hypothetical protein
MDNLSPESKVACPKCGHRFEISETLAQPLVDKVRREARALIEREREESARRLEAAREAEARAAEDAKRAAEMMAAVETKVNQRLAEERLAIQKAEREAAKKELGLELQAERDRAKDLESRLAEAHRAELALRQEKAALESRALALDLEVARKVDEQRKAIAEEARRAAAEDMALKLAEKDKTIADMQAKLEEAQRKGSQGSQQLQGEALELDFERALRQSFPQDLIEPVKTGQRGGDLLQRVLGQTGRPVGTVFWEIKRTQAWGGDWAAKAKQDARESGAEAVVIVTEALPKGLEHFGPHEGVWVSKPAYAVMVGCLLRQGIIDVSDARGASLGRESKMERLYAYMTGPEFRATLEGIAEPFVELRKILETEKRTAQARWKRQERHLDRVLSNVANLQGDLRAIAGAELAELPAFSEDGGGDEDGLWSESEP